MIINCVFMAIAGIAGSLTASVIILKFQGKITRKQSGETLKWWFGIFGLFVITIAGLYFANAYDWNENNTINNIVNIRFPSVAERSVTVSLYPFPVLTSILLSLLIFLVISTSKSLTVALKINPAQTDKRLLDYLHFKELLYCSIGILLFKLIVYFSAQGFFVNGLVVAFVLMLAIGALFYEILRWVHYPGYHSGLRKELLCCHVTGILILCFSFSI